MDSRTKYFGIVLIALAVTTFGIIKWSGSQEDPSVAINSTPKITSTVEEEVLLSPNYNFALDFGPRFNSITKEKLANVKSFDDLIGHEHAQRIESYNWVEVFILEDSEQTDVSEIVANGILSEAQLALIKSVPYSTNLLIKASYTEISVETGKIEESSWTPYLTVIPEKQAKYSKGKNALINHLREKSDVFTLNIEKDTYKSGKLYFTVSKTGAITGVKLKTSSGYPSIDKAMLEAVTNLRGMWEPAQNAKGENVDEQLVVSFGNLGC